MNILELGLNDFENWQVTNNNEKSTSLRPTKKFLVERNAVMVVELLPAKKEVDIYDFVEDYGKDLVGNNAEVVPIEENTGSNNENVTFGFISKGQDNDRYVIIRIENSPRSLICSRVELDVPNENYKGSFFDGNMSLNQNGMQIETDELIPYAITLRNLADTYSPLSPTGSSVDVPLEKFRNLGVGLSEQELLEAIGHPTGFRGSGNQFKIYELATGEEVHIKFKFGTTGWCIVIFPDDSQEELFGEC